MYTKGEFEQRMLEIKSGDLIALGEHRLLCGDAEKIESYEKLLEGHKPTMVWTDPPYNVNYAPLVKGDDNFKRRSKITIDNDALCDRCFSGMLEKAVTHLLASCEGAFYICMGARELPRLMNLFKDKGGTFGTLLVMVKSNFSLSRADYHPKHETILYGWNSVGKRYWCGSRKQHTLLEFKVTPNKLHPTMKPVAIIEKTIENSSPEGGSVLDVFAGSGSTLIAAHNVKRIAYLMEVSPHYCQVICDRFKEHTGLDPVKLN